MKGTDKQKEQNGANQHQALPSEKLIEDLQIHQLELEQQNHELRRTEEKLNRLRNDLEASRSRYYSLFNMAPVGYVVFAEDFRIREGNEIFCRMTGLSFQKILHERMYRFVEKDDQDVFHLHIRKLKGQEKSQCIVQIVARGEKHRVKMISSFHFDHQANEMLYYTALLDITRSVEQQQALKKLEEKYAKLIDRTETGFVELSPKDEIITCNRQFAEMVGQEDAARLKGQPISNWFADIFRLRQQIETNREEAQRGSVKLEIETAEGIKKTLSARGEMIEDQATGEHYIYTFFTDTSQQEELRHRIEQSNMQYLQLFQASKDGIVSASTDGRITNANQAFLDIVGYRLEEITGMHYAEFTHEESVPIDEDVMENQVAVKGYSDEYEKRYVRKDGSTVPVSLKIVSLFDEKGEAVQFWAIARDISEKKLQERKLREANENLQEMIYIASHDLQVPLISMESFATELIEEHSSKLSQEGLYALARMKKNAERMHNLVISLLNISRLNTHELPVEELNMKALAEQVIQDLSLRMSEQKAKITLEKLPGAKGDKTRITTLLRNLLSNSLNYGAKNILIGHKKGRYFVQDDGMGIPVDQLERIFKPGERLKMNQADGVGMGLTFCRKVVQKHQGQIWAESGGLGKGAVFYFTLFNPKN